jgi:hypothetical protein
MADSALSTDLLERYGAIEQAYCQERWSSVIHEGQTLLGDLFRSGEAPPEGLKERLQLLVAHAFLYGLGDRDSAEDLYQSVLRSGAEASLRQIAEQGLQQCTLPVAAPESQQEQVVDLQPDPAAEPTGETPLWPEATAAELQADPSISSPSGSVPSLQEGSAPPEGLRDDWGAATRQPAAGEEGALGWLTAAATAPPPQPAVGPVMPWLETGAAVNAAAGEMVQPVPANPLEEPVVRQDLQGPVSGSPQSEGLLAEAPLVEAPAAQGVPSAAAGMADGTPDGEPLPVADEASRLSPEPTTSLQALAASIVAGLDPSSRRPQPEALVDAAAADEHADLPPAPADASGGTPTGGGDGVEAFTPGPQASTAEERLVPDVVDEPELIELHQADSLLREELLVPAVAAEEAPLSEAADEQQVPASAESDLPAGLDRRGSDGIADVRTGGFQDRRAEPSPPPVPEEEPAPVVPDSRPQVVSGRKPFSAPPEPVAEEDPELLMGLLKVEMG